MNEALGEPVRKQFKEQQTWNIATEVLKREHDFFKQSDSFPSNCYSSRFMVERMQLSHHLTKLTNGDTPVMNFNSKGDLICAGCCSEDGKNCYIELIDWAHKKSKAEIVIESSHRICDVNFLNAEFYKDDVNIVSAFENGRLRHDALRPSGETIVMQMRQLTEERHKLAKCPGKEHELLSASASGNIFGIDLRCDSQETPTLLAQTKPVGKFVKLHAISHHPFAPQFCASFSDFNVRVYDKRKCDRPLHEICPKFLLETDAFAVFSDCLYNYDGSEILTVYTDANIYLYDSDNKHPGEFKQEFRQGGLVGFTNKISFFGPKSEYVIVGDDGQCIEFLNKVSGKDEASIALRQDGRFCSYDFLALKSHPHLPIVAASVQTLGLSILCPSSKEMGVQDDLMTQELEDEFEYLSA